MKLIIEAPRKTNLMQSIRIDMVKKDWDPLEESVAIEPIKGTKDWVDLKVYHCIYKKNVGNTETKTIRFYFKDKKKTKRIKVYQNYNTKT